MYGYEIFHNDIMKNLINSVHEGRASHAYIFEGNKGLKIYNAAGLFAAALTCEDDSISPCGACRSCIEAKALTNPDIIYVKPQKDRKTIGADDMRALEEDVSIKPFASRRKVYIFEDGSLLTEAAQNTFLKTFEEPPEYAVFIIIIENASSLLQTVLSRFTLVHFSPVKDTVIKEYIEKKYPEEKNRMSFLLKYCEGIPETADRVIEDGEFEELRNNSLKKLNILLSSDIHEKFNIQKYIDENKERAEDIFDFWLSFLRDALLIETQASENIMNIDKVEQIKVIASKYGPDYIVKMSDRIIRGKEMLRRYVNLKAVTMWISLLN